MILAVILAVIAGVISATRQYSKTDYTITLVGFLFLSLPVFWFAILLKQMVVDLNNSSNWYWISTYGSSTPGLTGWSAFSDAIGHLILPTIVLAHGLVRVLVAVPAGLDARRARQRLHAAGQGQGPQPPAGAWSSTACAPR